MEKIVERTSHPPGPKKSRKKSILLIDDCPDALEVNGIILEEEGYEVITAESGSVALSLLAKSLTPDLILLDMTMEEMSGMEFLSALEKQQPDILKRVPVVVLSALDSAPKSKATGFIRKPVQIDKFVTAVRYYIDNASKPGRYDH